MELFYEAEGGAGLSPAEQEAAVLRSLEGASPKKVLLIPPDITRFHSGAGFLTCAYYRALKDRCTVDVLPALGTHAPMTAAQCARMYPDIPPRRFFVHDWRGGVVRLGQVSGEYISQISGGVWDEPISVEVNRMLVEGGYDLIVSVGQVVPHEVIGMSNHSKNLFVGVGGSDMINKSHMLGAVYGMERMMGRDHTPVRRVFDYALEHFLSRLPIMFVLTVATAPMGSPLIHGLFIGDTRRVLDMAVECSSRRNIDWLDGGIDRCVVYLDPEEYTSTWLGNKAIYRTRMAINDGGELLVLAPGIEKFGEDRENDRLIRKYGYRGRLRTLELLKSEAELRNNMSAAAHLIHGSSDGRFSVCYAVEKLSREEIEGVGFGYARYGDAAARYNPAAMTAGYNVMPDGERVFYIPNPALGLWIDRQRF